MRIVFYTAEHLLTSETSDTRYVHDGLARHFDVYSVFRPDASQCLAADIVFCRFPKPVNTVFLHQLTGVGEKLIINNPSAQLRFGTKRNLLRFPELTMPTLISTSASEIAQFAAEYGQIVFKPLDKHKGQGVQKIDSATLTRRGLEDLITGYTGKFGTPVVQPFFDSIRAVGDKRINIFRFEPVSAVVTLPPDGSFVCHEAAGGSTFPAEITEHDASIIREILPFLREHDIWWAAIDVIGPYLSEINIATPSMIERADRAHENTRGLDAIVTSIQAYQHELGTLATT